AVDRQVDRFLEGTESNPTSTDDQRTRFLNPANNGRLDHWRVAVEAWQEEPLRGTGAGTFQLQWYQRRETDLNVSDAHSLYLDVLSDLGLVGLALLALGLLTIAGAVVRRTARRWDPGADRSLHAGLAAAMVAWGVHAGLDWMWELPAVTVWLFALGGFAVAGRVGQGGRAFPGRNVRVVVALGLLILAVVPLQMARSQRALEDGLRAFAATPRDCPEVIDHSLRSLASVGSRPEPWELIAYCDVGEGELGLAVQAARNAVARDPENWVYRYALALVQGVAGQDPRPAAGRALELNPRGLLANEAVRAFGRARRSRWPAVARRLKLPSG
ncbi:MAG: O-antigen ligase family protein, partial [Actinomycetota bacterium]|nr:O-antigen ligase family protein [Actinomycetota bacterium]